jgi:hypothetical protein
MRPLLLLDVDGPLNPHRAQGIPVGYEQHEIVEGAKTWVVLLNPRHGVGLNALAKVFDLVWELFFGGDHQLVHCVDARTGLTATDFAAVRAWAVRNSFAERPFRPHP